MTLLKNNIKLLLLGLVTPLLFGVSFAFDLNQDEINYLNSHNYTSGSFSNVTEYELGEVPNIGVNENRNVCVIFSGLTLTSKTVFNIVAYYNYSPQLDTVAMNYKNYNGNFFMYCLPVQQSNRRIWIAGSTLHVPYFTAEKYWLVDSQVIFNGNLGFDVQGLLNNYNQCSNSLDQCDTSVQQCLIDKENLSGSLATCNANNVSLQNNIDSLTLQLQNCLGQSCNGSGDSGTGLYFNQYNLFWSDENIDYSLPITNNLFLPLGYKGKINEDNVLAIAKINTLEASYQLSEEDKVTVIDILSIVMLFLLATGSLIGLIAFFKRLFVKH